MTEQLDRRPTDVRGSYTPNGQRFDIQTPQDLVRAGLGVNIDGVRRAWGEEGVAVYAQGMAARGLGHMIPAGENSRISNSGS